VLGSIVILSSHLRFYRQVAYFYLGLPIKIVYMFRLPHAYYMSHPSIPNDLITVLKSDDVMKFIVLQFLLLTKQQSTRRAG
jgi:hypothetical protein